MLPADDPFASLFKRTLEANYHPDIFQDEIESEYLTPQEAPISFYDRHIASRLTLKRVVHQPSLVSSLSRTCERAFQKFLDGTNKFCKEGYNFSLAAHRDLFEDACSISIYYNQFAAYLCTAYAYKLALHPERESWHTPFKFVQEARGRGYFFTAEAWLGVTRKLKDLPDLMNGVNKALEAKLQGLLEHYPRLATWHMFAMTDTATTMLQSLTKNASFAWETCRTLGCKTVTAPYFPPDAKISFIPSKILRRLKLRSGTLARKDATVKASRTVTVPKAPTKPKPYRPDFRHYIQHAWATAAASDSTYMIFHCGRYERIGVRDRASQTLYLSGLIDPINIKDPSYRKLQIGLHIAIVQDALERLELSGIESKDRQRCPANGPAEVEVSKDKNSKASPDNEAATSQFHDEIAVRDLALVTLDYGAFCSPAPSSFLRIGPSCVPGHAEPKVFPEQTRYTSLERMSLVLKEPLGQGAVGVVHPAVVSLTLESGDVLERKMVVKLAFTEEQRKKMYNEYRIYGHLSYEEGLEGIVTVHGMFKDPESGTVGMLMNDGGVSLRQRERQRGGDGQQVATTPEEREAFRRVLKGLHEAGVRHHDIRADNLLINSQNEVFIVDLDCADFEVSEENKEHEMECLNDLLEGRYRDGLYYSY